MADQEFDIYDDLLEFQQKEENKSKELQAWEDKYTASLQENEALRKENKDLRKKKKTIELSFQSLLDTARAEIKRLEKQITQLRKEKDDICFRRKRPRVELNQKQTFEPYVDSVITRKDEEDATHKAKFNTSNPFQDALKQPIDSRATIKTYDVEVSNSSSVIDKQYRNKEKSIKEHEKHKSQKVYNHRSERDERRRHGQRDASNYGNRSYDKHPHSREQTRYERKYDLHEDNHDRHDRSRREERHKKEYEKEKRHKSDDIITDRHNTKIQNNDVSTNIDISDNSEKIRKGKKSQVGQHDTIASYKERRSNDILTRTEPNLAPNEKIAKPTYVPKENIEKPLCTTMKTKDNEVLKSIASTLSAPTLAKETTDDEHLFHTPLKSRQAPHTTDVNSNTIQNAPFAATSPTTQIKSSDPTTPKMVALFNQLFGQTPVQAVTTSDDIDNKDLVTNVLSILNNTSIAMTPEFAYTPIQETYKVGVPNETKTFATTNLDECFIANKALALDLVKGPEIEKLNFDVELMEKGKELNSNQEETVVKCNEKFQINKNPEELFGNDLESEEVQKKQHNKKIHLNVASNGVSNCILNKITKNETSTVPKKDDANITLEDTNVIKKKKNTEIDECIDIDEELTAKNLASVSNPTIAQTPPIWKSTLAEDERLSNIVNTYNLLKSKLLPTAKVKEPQLLPIKDVEATETTAYSIVLPDNSISYLQNSNDGTSSKMAQKNESLAEFKEKDKLIAERLEDIKISKSNMVISKKFSEKPVSYGFETSFIIRDSSLAEKVEIDSLASNERKDVHNTVKSEALVYEKHTEKTELDGFSNEKKLLEKEQIIIIEDIRLPNVLDLENISSDTRLIDEQVAIKTTSDKNRFSYKSDLFNIPDNSNNKQSFCNELNRAKLVKTPEKQRTHVTDEIFTDPLHSISSDAIEMALSALHDSIPLSPKKRYSRHVLSKTEQENASQNNESSDDLLNILGNNLNDKGLLGDNECEEDAVSFVQKLNRIEVKKDESNEKFLITNETVSSNPIFQTRKTLPENIVDLQKREPSQTSNHSSEIILPAANVLIQKSKQPADIKIETVNLTLDINSSGVHKKTSKLKKFKIPKVKKDEISNEDKNKILIDSIDSTDSKLAMTPNAQKQARSSSSGQKIENLSLQTVKRGRGRPRKNPIKEREKPGGNENLAEKNCTNASIESVELPSSADLISHNNDSKKMLSQHCVEHSTFDRSFDMMNSTANNEKINHQEQNNISVISDMSLISECFEDQTVITPPAKRRKLDNDAVLPISSKAQNSPIIDDLIQIHGAFSKSPTYIENNAINSICDDCPTNTSSISNVTIDETVVSCVADTSSTSLKNNSSGGIVTKCVSLGSSEYRFEQMPNNTIKLVVKRHGRLRRPNNELSTSTSTNASRASANSVLSDVSS